MLKLAALDLGSNSFHLLEANFSDNQLTFGHRIKDKVQIGAGLDRDQNLSQRSINRGLLCLKTFQYHIKKNQIKHVVAVGTNTLRVANNCQYFLRQAEEILGYEVEVISGAEEANLIFSAVQTEINRPEIGMAIDIGGGSTEFAVGDATSLKLAESLEMGCVSYYGRFFADGKIYQENVEAAIMSARLELDPYLAAIKSEQTQWISGTSGSIQSIAILAHHFFGDELNTLSFQSICKLQEKLIESKHVNNLDFEHLEVQRRSILPAGLSILKAIFIALDLEQIKICQTSLCEGLLIKLCTSLNKD